MIDVVVFFFLLDWAPPGMGRISLMATPPPRITEVQPLNAVLNEMPERPGLPMPTPDEETPEKRRIADAKRLALENPAAVANIVKGWVNGESATG